MSISSVKLAVLFGILCFAAFAAGPADFVLDTDRYIPLDEVRPGMKAYCLTAYQGTKIEKFALEVLSVVKNMEPARNAILVMGKDPRFIHTGPVAGCSGSPVYIEGRLAGALSFGWPFSKDPLYGVTPIEEMVRPSVADNSGGSSGLSGVAFDFSGPIDLSEIEKQLEFSTFAGKRNSASEKTLPCVLTTSGISHQAYSQISDWADSLGLTAVAGGGSGGEFSSEKIELEPGGCLAIPLLTGDIEAAVVGTVTDVVGNDVYAFGHSFMGYGEVDLPMAVGKVHTVVSSVMRSFKFASALDIVGAVRFDESTVVRGQIGAEPSMLPLTITVQRYNDPQRRTYNCQIADNKIITPQLIRFALAGASVQYGNLPPEHSVRYKANIQTDRTEPLVFENISTDDSLRNLITEGMIPVALLMNNPFGTVGIESLSFDINIDDKSLISHIWSVDLSDSKVKAGQKLQVDVIVESIQSRKKKYSFVLDIPKQLQPGKYDLIICGGAGYQNFLQKAARHKFLAEDIKSLAEALNLALSIKRDRLYCILVLPKGGITINRTELPDLPSTKMLILIDEKRTINAAAYQHWIEKSTTIDSLVADGQKMEIIIEQ